MNDNGSSEVRFLLWMLTFLFLGLKLGGVISWSWWWVFSPIWIALMIGGLALAFIALIAFREDRRNTRRSGSGSRWW